MSRPMRRSSPRNCGFAPASSCPPSRRRPAGSARASFGSTSAGEGPAYNPRTCQPPPRPPPVVRALISARPVGTSSASPCAAPPRGVRPITRGPDGRTAPDEARCRRRARPARRLARHARHRRTERGLRGALEGSSLSARDLEDLVAPRAGGDAPGRRDDPERVLLRRIGRHPGLPPEGHRDRQQAAGPPGRSARTQDGRRQRADRGRGGRRARQRDVRRDRRSGRGLPHPPGAALDPARPASRARAAVGRARARRLARRDLGRRLARPHLAQRHREARRRRAQGRDADAPSAIGDGASPPPVRLGRRLRGAMARSPSRRPRSRRPAGRARSSRSARPNPSPAHPTARRSRSRTTSRPPGSP